MAGDREKCMDAGCSGFLAKPVDIDELIVLVSQHVIPSSADVADHSNGADAKAAVVVDEESNANADHPDAGAPTSETLATNELELEGSVEPGHDGTTKAANNSSLFVDRLIAGIEAEEADAAPEAVELQSLPTTQDASDPVEVSSLYSNKEDLYPAKRQSTKKVVGDSVEKLISKQANTDVKNTTSTLGVSAPETLNAEEHGNNRNQMQSTSPMAAGDQGELGNENSIVRLSQFEYFFHEQMGAIDLAIEAGKYEELESLAKVVQHESFNQNSSEIGEAAAALVNACQPEEVDVIFILQQVKNLTAVATTVFEDNLAGDSVCVDYKSSVRRHVSAIQKGWELKNFRLMESAFKKLQCESFVSGRSTIGEALNPLIESCEERDLKKLNKHLTPLLKVVRSEMTVSGVIDCSRFQAIQMPNSVRMRSAETPIVSDVMNRQSKKAIRLEVQTDASKVADPIFSSLPSDADFREIVADFIPQIESKLEEMLKAIETKDFVSLLKLGHWLKGAGGTVGFDHFFEPSHEMELAAKAQDLEACEACFSLLLALSQRIVVPEVTK
jgi:HPt (histidine-containing phosphotransfer) domain-containing protein